MDRGERLSPRERGGPARAAAGGRIPPHNLQAEESVLGAILLSRDALGAVIEAGLRYDDFYKPAHQHIFDVAVAVSQSGGPVDTITVAEELSRLGLLDQAGGVEALHALQNATPAISNAASYAKIVQDAAMLRRLILVAADISEIGYGRPDNVDDALDDAESRVFRVADRRVVDSYRDIGELMKLAVDRIEENFARGDTITGIATGYNDLDELLSGLQPSTLNIVGARPAMGKCVHADTPMIDLVTGELVTAAAIFDLAASRGALDVLSLDTDGRLRPRAVSACLDDGIKPVFEVVTSSGRTVTITASHPLLTARGWRPLADISVGDHVAVPSSLPVFGTDDLPDAEIDLLARDAKTAIPTAAFRLPRLRFARFIKVLFGSGELLLDRVLINYRTESEQLARELAHALTRFGIRTTLAVRGRAFEVEVVDTPSLLTFCDEIGILGAEAAVDRVRAAAASAPHGLSPDLLPAAVWDDIDKARGELSWADVSRRCGLSTRYDWQPSRRGPVRRQTVAQLAEALDDDRLRWWASPDVTWDRIAFIEPVGEARVIDFTVPEVHNFVAADLYLHNTAFGLGIATHVAKHSSRPVLVFSLEMGHVELTQRILASEAEVDSQKIRNGRLSEADWAKIGRAIGRLEVPLFLDDNPRVTVMEIRAKARRLKMQHGDLGLILVDYLQLMSSGGYAENRQLEVSEISRNLKILARELEVPIVALSQLSRNLESRSDKHPMLSDLRESGCLTADTRLLRADTNTEVTIGELVECAATNVPVWSLDRDLRMVPATLTRAFSSGVKEVFAVRLASGRLVKASANHPFLTIGGWKRLDELDVGARIAVPRVVPDPLEPRSWPDDHVILVAHLLGDGCFASGQPLHYTSGDPANIDIVEKAAVAFGIQSRRVPQGSYVHLYLSAGRGLARGRRNPIASWLDGLGLYGLRSHEKFIPTEIFGLPTRQVALFLHHLWATDGSLGVYKWRDGDRAAIYYSSTSRRLIDDLQLLLSRFALLTRVSESRKGTHRASYQLYIVGSASMRRFLDEIGVYGARGDRVSVVWERMAYVTKDAYCDSLPDNVTALVAAAIGASAMSPAEISRRAGLGRYTVGRAPVPRWRLRRIADVLDDNFLRMLATSDVHWDRVVDIAPLGPQQVFDATVAETHNFVANGITLENSLEQDADVVIFLYRDEVYNKESPDRGAADVIVAKHRAGPTGAMRLVFRGQYARFDNAAPRGMA